MGWLYQHDKLRHETPVQYVTREFSHQTATATATVIATVIAAAAVRGTIYAAIRNDNKQTGRSYVFCAVILFKNSERTGFGYKAMDETMGPCEVDCPDRIFRLLSPVSEIPGPGYAADWRSCVAEAKAAKTKTRAAVTTLSVGDRIKLTHAAHFCKGNIVTGAFTVLCFDKRTPIFVADGHPGLICRLRKSTLVGATIRRD